MQLDEIFQAFDSKTRQDFQTWMQGAAAALDRRGVDLSTAIASLDSFAREADSALRILDSQDLAVSDLVSRGGEVFDALSERQGELSGLIENTQAVFSTTADRNADLQALFQVLPTFLRESRETLTRLDDFATDADPVITQLRPSARELGPTLTATGRLAAELEVFFGGLRGAIDAAPSGFGALRGLLDDQLPPLLDRLPSFLDELTPIVTVLRKYRREITAFLANVAAATNATNDEGAGVRNYLRTIAPFSPEILASYAQRLSSVRPNPYFGRRGLRPGRGTEVVRDAAVHLGDQRDPRSRRRLEPGLQRAYRGRRRRRAGPARPDAAVRVRRPDGVVCDPAARLRAGAAPAVDRRGVRGVHPVPARALIALSGSGYRLIRVRGREVTRAPQPSLSARVHKRARRNGESVCDARLEED